VLYFEFSCVQCRVRLRVSVKAVRPRVKCPSCLAVFRVPIRSGRLRLIPEQLSRMAMFMYRSMN
jgi:hypothetical protein